ARERPDQDGESDAARVDHRDESRDGAHQHHALEAQVDDARPLPDQLRDRGVQQRRAREDRPGQEAPQGADHRVAPCRPRTTKRMMAIRMLTTEPGSVCVIWRMSPPAVTTESRNDAATMPRGWPLAIQLIRKPV